MSIVRIVGDVHGKFDGYINLIKDCEYSLQVGDMGFNYEQLSALNPSKHQFMGGNQDN